MWTDASRKQGEPELMKVHEYQARELLVEAAVPVPASHVVESVEQAVEAFHAIGGRCVVKAQVFAGGRGKAGGVKLVSTADEAGEFAASILGTSLVTFQTGPEGVPVRKVLVEETIDVADELYLAMVIDGAAEGVVAIASEAGGMDIEQVAEDTPDKIVRVAVDPVLGLQPYQGRHLAYGLNVSPELVRPISALVEDLYRVFQENDCSLAEINPLVITADGRVLALNTTLPPQMK